MAIDSDLELMLRVRSGDAGSFEILLNRYRLPLVGYFVRMVRDRALAEDLAQEAFLRVYRARDRYEAEARFTTWLYRIATNLALNALRDRKPGEIGGCGREEDGESRLARLPDRAATAEEQLIIADRARLIREAVEALPERQRVAVILHKYQDLDYHQIGKVLGLSESAVKSLLFRAHENLRARLEPLFGGGQL